MKRLTIIEDGKGTGSKAEVTTEGLLRTEATSIPFAFHVNEHHQEAYSIIVEKTPAGAGDCFFYIKNDGDMKFIGIEILLAVETSLETISMRAGLVGTPIGGTERSLLNVNAGSGHKADVTCYDGTDITGLVGGADIFKFRIAPDETSRLFKTDTYMILPKNHNMALYVTTGGIPIHCVMSMVFHK